MHCISFRWWIHSWLWNFEGQLHPQDKLKGEYFHSSASNTGKLGVIGNPDWNFEGQLYPQDKPEGWVFLFQCIKHTQTVSHWEPCVCLIVILSLSVCGSIYLNVINYENTTNVVIISQIQTKENGSISFNSLVNQASRQTHCSSPVKQMLSSYPEHKKSTVAASVSTL